MSPRLDYCEVDWNASFVHAFEAAETRRRKQEQQQSYRQAHGHGPFAGGAADPREFFEQFMRDPFSWFEKHFAQQQQQQFWQQFQQQAGRQQQQQYQQQQQQYGGGRPGGTAAGAGPRNDPLGYYQTLGVKPGCSTQEVQAAFRGLALQHHPDRYSSPADKERATKKFQGITEAYQVLRDPKKRQLYDAGQYHDRA